MDEDRRRMARATALSLMLCVTGLLVLLSFLQPVDAYPIAAAVEITPTSFAYLPYIAQTGPSPTPLPPGVDLIVWDIDIDPDTPTVGQTFLITTTVKNQRGDNAPAATFVSLSVDGWQLPDRFIAPLAGGATADVVWALSLSSAGSYTARGEVDPTDLVAETDEDNNMLQQPFNVVSSSQ